MHALSGRGHAHSQSPMPGISHPTPTHQPFPTCFPLPSAHAYAAGITTVSSPFRQTFIAELANGAIGYIPNQPAYLEGNYEVISARCAAGSGEMLVDSAVRQLQMLFAAARSEMGK